MAGIAETQKLRNLGQNKQVSEEIYIFNLWWTVPLSVILAAVVSNVFSVIECG